MDEQNQFYAQQRDPNEAVMSMGEWMITLLVQCIPCIGIIMTFVWAFGDGNQNRKNYCRAGLVFAAIATVLGIIFYGTLAGIVLSNISSYR